MNLTNTPVTQRPLKRTAFAVAVGILLIVLLISIALLVSAALKAQIDAFGVLALMAVAIVAVVAALATTDVIPWHDLSLAILRQPRVLGTLALLMLATFSTLYSLVPLLEQKGGAKAVSGDITQLLRGISADTQHTAEGVNEIGNALGIGERTLVEQRLSGIWGEAGCVQTYRFTLESHRLLVDSVTSLHLPGNASFHAEFTRISAANSVSRDGPRRSTLYTEEAKNSLFGDDKGIAVDFVLTSNGTTDHLLWDRKGQQQGKTELVRCSALPSDATKGAIE